MTVQAAQAEFDLTGWVARPLEELLRTQLAALDAWNREQHVIADREPPASRSREMRLDAARRLEVRQREQAAIYVRADAQSDSDLRVLASGRPRAVVAHRNAWFREKLSARLAQHGVLVVASVNDGAEAAAAVVFDQPDVLLVEDLLPILSGAAIVTRTARFSSQTVIGATAMDQSELARLAEHGARAVFTRRVPPTEVADALLSVLCGRSETVELH